MPTNAINDTGVKYLYDKLHGEIEPIAEAVSDSEVTIEGNPLSFNTLSSQKAKSTILSVEPIQDLHGYDKPWVGGAGKNKFNDEPNWKNGYYLDASGHEISNVEYRYTQEYMPVVESSIYALSLNKNTSANVGVTACLYNSSNQFLERKVPIVGTTETGRLTGLLQTTAQTKYIRVSIPVDSDTCQLEEGSSSTPYEPYENICPISGRTEIGILGCGKNLVDTSTFLNGFYDGNDWNFVSHNNYRSFKVFVKSGTWVLSTSESVGLRRIEIDGITSSYNEDITTFSITVSKDCYIGVSITKPSDSTTFQLEYGSQSTEYTAYQSSNNVTIAFGQTVYGGTLDVENGVLTINKAYAEFDGSNDENWDRGGTTNNIYFTLSGFSDCIAESTTIILCNRLSYAGISSTTTNIGCQFNPSSVLRLRYKLDNTLTVSDLRTWLSSNNLQLVYPITPITINLTPHTIKLLEGVNNISTDGDKITLTYRDGSVATLGDLTSAVDNLDSKIDESKILTYTVTGDKYILVVTNGVLSVQQVSN